MPQVYDTVNDTYLHRLQDEILPVVGKSVKMLQAGIAGSGHLQKFPGGNLLRGANPGKRQHSQKRSNSRSTPNARSLSQFRSL